MTRTHIFVCIMCLMLTACSYQYQRGNTLYPNAKYARANAASGLRYLHKGDTNSALAKLQTALQQSPRDPVVIDALAFYYEKTGEVNKADAYYVYALSTDLEQGTANKNYGAFLCRNGRYQESLFYLRQAANIPNYPNAKSVQYDINYCSQKMRHALGEQSTWAYYMARPTNY